MGEFEAAIKDYSRALAAAPASASQGGATPNGQQEGQGPASSSSTIKLLNNRYGREASCTCSTSMLGCLDTLLQAASTASAASTLQDGNALPDQHGASHSVHACAGRIATPRLGATGRQWLIMTQCWLWSQGMCMLPTTGVRDLLRDACDACFMSESSPVLCM